MDNMGKGTRDIYTSTTGIRSRGLSPPHVSKTLSNTNYILTPIVSLNFSTTTLGSPNTRVIIPFVHVNPTTRYSTIVFISIHGILFTSSPFSQNF